MMIVISPAKTLDFERKLPVTEHTQPHFIEEADFLVTELKKFSPARLSRLMSISPKLAQLNYDRFAAWQLPLTLKNSRPALFAFNGDVYDGLDAYSLTKRDISYTQKRLRILSGMYGLLLPLDLILSYRLEMGTSLSSSKGKDLYSFWGHRISGLLRKQMEENHDDVLINLASREYYKAIGPDLRGIRTITPVFKDLHEGEYKIISFFAKKARGLMSRFIIQHRISRPIHIKAFDEGGYRYNPALSKGDEFVFTRG